MATRIDLPRTLVVKAIETHVNTLKRSATKYADNPIITDALQKEISNFSNAANTSSEIK